MAVYIVKEGKKLTIITVKPDLEAAFRADYAGKILVAGDSIQDVVIRFGELPQLQALNEELNQGKSPSKGDFLNDLLPNRQEVVSVCTISFFSFN